MLLSWVVLPVVMLAVAAGCGMAVSRAAGEALPRALVLPVGLAAMIVVASSATASKATAELAAPLVLALAATGWLVAGDRRAWIPEPAAIVAAIGVYGVFAAPSVLSGTSTFTGYIQLDDIATWLAMTDHVMTSGRDLTGLQPSTHLATLESYLPGGYPVGAFLPLGLGRQFLLGRDIAWLFAPTMALTSGLLALTITAIVQPVLSRPWARAAVAFLAAQAALLVAYAEWGAIKEITAALLVALVAALAPLLGSPAGTSSPAAARRVLPLGVAISATVAALSFGGGVWVAPVVLVALAASRVRPTALLVGIPAVTAVVVLLSIPSLQLAKLFLAPQLKSGSVLTVETELGNLRTPLPFTQVLGLWPAGDFRSEPEQMGLTTVLLVLVGVAAAAGLGVALRRRAGALTGYLAGGLLACVALISRGSPWVDGKVMATASPMVLTAALAALAWLATERVGELTRRLALVGLGAVAAGVLWSNVLGYANSYIAPAGQLAELEAAGELLSGQGPTLMTEYEPYGARHFLRKADGESASELRRRLIPLRDGSQLPKSAAADVLAFDPTALREYRSLVLRTSPVASRPPSSYVRRTAGESYDVWQRDPAATAPPAADLDLGGPLDAGAVPACDRVRALARAAGPNGRLVAVRRTPPVALALSTAQLTGGFQAFADPRFVTPVDDGRLTARVEVPSAGDYAVWVGGSTRGRTTVLIDGRETASVRGRLNNQGGMMRFGRAELSPGPHRIEVVYSDDGLAPGQRGQLSQPLVLGPLVLSAEAKVPEPFSTPTADADQLCGQHLDWIEAQTS